MGACLLDLGAAAGEALDQRSDDVLEQDLAALLRSPLQGGLPERSAVSLGDDDREPNIPVDVLLLGRALDPVGWRGVMARDELRSHRHVDDLDPEPVGEVVGEEDVGVVARALEPLCK